MNNMSNTNKTHNTTSNGTVRNNPPVMVTDTTLRSRTTQNTKNDKKG